MSEQPTVATIRDAIIREYKSLVELERHQKSRDGIASLRRDQGIIRRVAYACGLMRNCPACNGSGGKSPRLCDWCAGQGWVWLEAPDA